MHQVQGAVSQDANKLYTVRLRIQKAHYRGRGGYLSRSEYCSWEEVLQQIEVQAPIKKHLTLLQAKIRAQLRGYMLLAHSTSVWVNTHIRLINM